MGNFWGGVAGVGVVIGVCFCMVLVGGCGAVGLGGQAEPVTESGDAGVETGTTTGVGGAVTEMPAGEVTESGGAGVETGSPASEVATERAGGSGPQVLSFTVMPTITPNVGDAVQLAWEALGEEAEICPIEGQPVLGACISTALNGTMVLTTSEAMLTYDSLGLRVTVGDQMIWATQDVVFECQNLRTWFFTPQPERCPQADAVSSAATTQPFEHGSMVWFEASDTYYVFYESGGSDYPSPVVQIVTGPLDVQQGLTNTTTYNTETPPVAMSAPEGDFGSLWRGEVAGVDNAAELLGWATGPVDTYQSDYQCEMSGVMHGWTCYLLGPDNEVLRMWPDSTAQVHILWTPVQ